MTVDAIVTVFIIVFPWNADTPIDDITVIDLNWEQSINVSPGSEIDGPVQYTLIKAVLRANAWDPNNYITK